MLSRILRLRTSMVSLSLLEMCSLYSTKLKIHPSVQLTANHMVARRGLPVYKSRCGVLILFFFYLKDDNLIF